MVRGVIEAGGMIRKLSCLPDLYSGKDLFYERMLAAHLTPEAATTEPYQPVIIDQGQEGSCTACGSTRAGLATMKFADRDGTWCPGEYASIAAEYFWTREVMGTVNQDSGATVRGAVMTLVRRGMVRASAWPYVPENFAVKPPADVEEEALMHQAVRVRRLGASGRGRVDVLQVHDAIARGLCVVFGMALHESFEHVGPNGMVPIPGPREQVIGGHCMVVTAYDQSIDRPWEKVANSWGKDWGRSGYCFIDADHFKREASDAWVVETEE